MKIHTLVLFLGYAESATSSALVVNTQKGYRTAFGALRAFEKVFRGWLESEAPLIPAHCREAIQAKAKYCSVCGTPTRNWGKAESRLEVLQALRNLHSGDADSTGSFWDYANSRGWSIGYTRRGDLVEVMGYDRFLGDNDSLREPHVTRIRVSGTARVRRKRTEPAA